MAYSLRARVAQLIDGSGITLGGAAPWDLQVHDERFYARVLSQGSLGLGESYMDGWWDAAAPDELMTHLLRFDIESKLQVNAGLIFDALHARLVNEQSKRRAFQVGEAHYDIGNDLYAAMLDSRMVYTCGYWKNAENL